MACEIRGIPAPRQHRDVLANANIGCSPLHLVEMATSKNQVVTGSREFQSDSARDGGR